MNNIDPDNLETFHIPEGVLQELFELTGESESSRGFVLACVGQDGRPFIYSKSASQVIELGIRKALEDYLTEIQEGNSLDFLSED
tara:strand:- start:814 stop:1068 length:255 start_codon:yes stop_codon:yes gene_type:complete